MAEFQVFDISRNWRKFSLDAADLNDPDSNTQDLTFLALMEGEELDRLTLAISEEFTGDPLLNSTGALSIEPMAGDGTANHLSPVLRPLPTTDAADGNAALSLSYFGNTMPQGNVFAVTPRAYKLRFIVNGPDLAAVAAGSPSGILRYGGLSNAGTLGGYQVGDTGITHGGNEDATYEIASIGEARGPIATSHFVSPGGSFAEGDTFTVQSTWTGVDAVGVVDTVDGGGAILTYHLTNNGTAFAVTVSTGLKSTSGSGAGASFAIDSVTGGLPATLTLTSGGTGYSSGSHTTSTGGSQPGVGGGDMTVAGDIAYMGYAVVAVLSDGRHSNWQDEQVPVLEGHQLQWAAPAGIDHFDIYFTQANDNGSSALTLGKVATLDGDVTSYDVGYTNGDGLDMPDFTNTIPRMSMLNGGKLDVYAEVLSLL